MRYVSVKAIMLTYSDLLTTLKRIGFSDPTPIQKEVFPLIMERKNVLVIAPTGSGKTEAAVIPIITLMKRFGASPISAIYVTPLRALNRDLESRLVKIGESLEIKVGVRHGDSSQKERRRIKDQPPDLLITTPETLNFLLVNKGVRESLKNVRWIVVDELQELIDEKRGAELSIVLERIKRVSQWKVQVIGLSATIGDTSYALRFIDPLGQAEVAKTDNIKEMEMEEIVPQPNQRAVEKALNTNLSPDLIARLEKINELISVHKPVLIFTNTRETAEFLSTWLNSMFHLRVSVHHGSLSKEVRVEAESKFKNGELDVLVATSSLELGIDIGKIEFVVQYMSPRQVNRLIQRIGRSGHRIGGTPRGVVVPSPDTFDVLECRSIIMKAKEGYLEKPTIESKPLDVLAHQITGMVLEGYVDQEEIYRIVRGAQPFRDLTENEFNEVIDFLEQVRVLRRGNRGLSVSRRAWRYFYGTSMIPDSFNKYTIIEVASNSKVGELDEEFAATLENDEVFVLAGRLWRVVTIEKGKIFVERAQRRSGLLPSWFGETIPVEAEVAKRVYEMLIHPEGLNEEVRAKIDKSISEMRRRGFPLPGPEKVAVEIMRDLIVVHSPFGSRGNNTLGALLSQYLAQRKGIRTSYKSDPYHIALASVIPVSKNEMEEVFTEIASQGEDSLISVLERAIVESPPFKWKMVIELQRFGVIDRDSEVDINSTIIKAYVDTLVGREAIKELLCKDYDLDILGELKRLRVEIVESPSPSPLSSEFLERIFADVKEGSGNLIDLIKRRLSSKELRVICLNCSWSSTFKAAEIPRKCPKCDSVFITLTHSEDTESQKIVSKFLSEEKLSRNEMKRLEELKKVASLAVDYGNYAAIAIAARGVGPSNLDRVLSKLRNGGEDKFYEAIMEAERNFIKYRRYWQS